MTSYPAKSVTVARVYFATCNVDGCGWAGPNRAAFADAGSDRQQHLDQHNAGGSDG